jgi:hypothetical protein
VRSQRLLIVERCSSRPQLPKRDWGVDLLPDGLGSWVAAELNGAVEFTHEYAACEDDGAV